MDKDVIEKCLAFCQALSNSNQLFSFNLKIGSDSFNFDMKELAKSSCVKKKSPSQLRREKRRRDERKRAATKAEEDIAKMSDKSVMVKPKCDPCGKTFNSEEELNAHRESVHKALPTPEKERSIASCSDLQLSPIHMQRDEEKLSEQEAASSPLPCVASPPQKSFYRCYEWMCDKPFPSEEDLRVHIHEYHSTSSLNVG